MPYRRDPFASQSRKPARNTYSADRNDKRVAIGLARSKPEEFRSWEVDDGYGYGSEEPFPITTQLALHDAVDVAVQKFEELQFNKMVKGEYELVKEPEMEEFVFV